MFKSSLFLNFWHVFLGFSLILLPFFSIKTEVKHLNQLKSFSGISKLKSSDSGSISRLLKLPILMYYHIDTLEYTKTSDKIGSNLRVSPSVFEEQLKYLKTQNYNPINSQDFSNYLNRSFKFPNNSIMLTFDDGYKNNFTNTFPLLQKYGFKGDFAIITGVVGTSEYMSREDSYKSKKPIKNINLDDLNDRNLYSEFNSGDILNTGQVFQELNQSKVTLESKLGIKITQIVYPYGHYNSQVEDLAKKPPYKFASTVEPEYNNIIDSDQLFTTSKVRIHGQQDGKLQGFFENI